MEIRGNLAVGATLVANEFIDRYMAAASGEYVKVYLYVMRHQGEELNLSGIAEALQHTESDVRRALAYWQKVEALRLSEEEPKAGAELAAAGCPQPPCEPEAHSKKSELSSKERPRYSQDQVNRLGSDSEYTQLLYIAQKYMNQMFTQRECEVFAYLYDGLHLSVELLEYVVEYCVQSGHSSIRYIEAVALSWHQKGLRTVEEAKEYASSFTKDSFAVMRAFGLTGRNPGEEERAMIEQWFREYGFTRELVLEACNRTLAAIHEPSFRYADKILREWKKSGVHSLKQVAELDEKRRSKNPARTAASPQGRGQKKVANQFHNFEPRNIDYDAIVLDQVKAWMGNPEKKGE